MNEVDILQKWKPKHKEVTSLIRVASTCDKTKSI